jgi:hypothetical protein
MNKRKVKWIVVGLVLLLITYLFAQESGYFRTITISNKIDFDGLGSGESISPSTTDQMDIDATTEVEITTATVDVNGILDVSGRINNGSTFWADAPSPANNDKSIAFFYENDFVGEVLFPVATGVANGWKATGDATYDVLSDAGTLGGWCLLAPEGGSNNGVDFQMGQIGTETFVEFTKDNGKEVWLEYNLTPSSVTNAANWFVGLAEEGVADGDFIVDAGNDIADVDAVGFMVFEGDPNALLAIYQLETDAYVDTFSTAITAVNMTLGIHFDGVSTVTWYKDGASIGTIETDEAVPANQLFPAGEELSPLIAMKQGASAININLDWIKLVAER